MSVSSQANTGSTCSDALSGKTSTSNLHSSCTSPSDTSPLRPAISRGETCGPTLESARRFDPKDLNEEDEESPSVEWIEYTDTVPPAEDDETDSAGDYQDLDRDIYQEYHENDAFPATSREFANLFPSSRRLEIRHDDSTTDGNMNLRMDTTISLSKNRTRKLTLFHLRMQDLRRREFSLRRYCRDSGREICHSSKKQPQIQETPALAGSFSNILASLKPPTPNKLKRQDSGYDSIGSDESQWSKYSKSDNPSDIISLEFSNYTHLDLKRRGFTAAKRYDLEYWGLSYSWKRVSRKVFGVTEVSYHLLRRSDKQLVAHIVPVPLTDDEAKDEADAGGWVPPCSMWLSDKDVINDSTGLSDVIIATGLVALADDSIRRRFQGRDRKQLLLTQFLQSPVQLTMKHIGVKAQQNDFEDPQLTAGIRRNSH